MKKTNEYILSLSYGKDSLACLGAIEQLGWPLDRIVHAEVWATDTIPADLPPMVEFKKKADKIIKERWGIEVEHVFAQKDGVKQTYESIFYRTMKPRERERERATHDARIPWSQLALVHRQTQDEYARQESMDSQSSEDNGATQCSRCRRYGWANRWAQYCTGELKKQALFCQPQNEGR